MASTLDSGWSWVVMAASSLNNVIIFGIIKSGGLFYVALMKELSVTRSEAALCSSLIYSLSCLLAPVSAFLCTRFSHKSLVFNGGLLASVGMILAATVPLSFVTILLFYGVFTGVGLGLVLLPSVTIVHSYFNKHRTFAVGFSMAGASIGAFAVPPAFEIVLQEYNLQHALLVLAAFILHICPAGLLFRPQPVCRTPTTRKEDATQTEPTEKITLISKPVSKTKHQSTIMKLLSSFCEKQYLFLLYSYIMFAIVWSGYLTFLQEYAISETSDDVTPFMAVSILSAMSSGDLVCRFIFGWVSDRGWFQRQDVYTFSLLMAGVVLISYTTTLSYTGLLVASVFFGIFISGVIVLPSVLLYDHFGPERFQVMFGITCCINGIIAMSAASLLAYVRELSGTYKTCFLIMGFCFISSSLFWIVEKIYLKFKTHESLSAKREISTVCL